MNISNSPININRQFIQKTYGKNTDIKQDRQATESVKTPEKKVTDSVVLSSATKDMQKVSAYMDTQPEQRTEKIAELKSMVEQGMYTVDPAKVAEKMVGTFLNTTS